MDQPMITMKRLVLDAELNTRSTQRLLQPVHLTGKDHEHDETPIRPYQLQTNVWADHALLTEVVTASMTQYRATSARKGQRQGLVSPP